MKYTSYIAGQYITDSGRRETLKEKVYCLIKKYPHVTQREIGEAYGESCRKRVGDLLNDKTIYESGTRKIEGLTYTTYCVKDVVQQEMF